MTDLLLQFKSRAGKHNEIKKAILKNHQVKVENIVTVQR